MWWIIGISYSVGVILTMGILIGIGVEDDFAVPFGAMFFPITIIIVIGIKIGEFVSGKLS